MRNQSGIADLIVKGAIALITAAFFIGAYLQFQLAFWLALVVALAVYISLLLLHALMRRSERVGTLATEVSRLEGELARLKGQDEYVPPVRVPQPRAPIPTKPAMGPPPASIGGWPEPRMPAPPPAAEKAPAASATVTPLQARGAKTPAPGPALPSAPATRPDPQLPTPSGWQGKAAGAEPMHDYWSFRPVKPTADVPAQQQREAGAPHRVEPLPPRRGEGPERETDLEAVQGMIKRLADELSVDADATGNAPHGAPDHAVRASVDALHATAETMRAAASGKAPPPAARREREPSPSMPPPIAPGHTRLASVAAAIAAGRMDVLVKSIVGLADHQVHHYELVICPRDERGALLALGPHDPQLARTGLHPLVDAARIARASQICRSLAQADRRACVFSPTSAESLSTDRFLDELANIYRQREALAGELVLAFAQADVKGFGGTEWSALTDMRDLGFRFGLESVTDVDYEFSALRAAGFAFVKIDAARFVHGLPGPNGVTTAADVCRHLAELGLAVIVGGIVDEATRNMVLNCGVPLGEGPLFGPPRAVTGEVHVGPGPVAA